MIRSDTINGHRAVWMENGQLSVCVLPEKGADIYQLIYRPAGIQFLMQTPWGLKPPKVKPENYSPPTAALKEYIATDFLENYEGGWQELFPNPNDAATYNGAELPFHGEAALLPWDYCVMQAEGPRAEALFQVILPSVPFRLERTMRLRPEAPELEIDSRVVNLSDQTQRFTWGHHVVLGGNFLEAGCRLETPAGTIYTPEILYEPETAKLAPGQAEPWPLASGRRPHEPIDLRQVPGPEARQHDDIFLGGLAEGRVEVSNPRLGLRFKMEWDAHIFGCLVNWRPLGGADLPPLTGIYGMGIEPWVSRFGLTEAIEKGEALKLGPGEELETKLVVKILKE